MQYIVLYKCVSSSSLEEKVQRQFIAILLFSRVKCEFSAMAQVVKILSSLFDMQDIDIWHNGYFIYIIHCMNLQMKKIDIDQPFIDYNIYKIFWGYQYFNILLLDKQYSIVIVQTVYIFNLTKLVLFINFVEWWFINFFSSHSCFLSSVNLILPST